MAATTSQQHGSSSQSEPPLHPLSHYGIATLTYALPDWMSHNPITCFVTEQPWVTCVVFLVVSAGLLLQRLRCRRHPPGPWGWPVYGHTDCLLTNPHYRLSHLRDVYGDVYQLRCGGRRVVVVSSLEGILEGLVERGHDLSARPDFESYRSLYRESRQQGVCTGDMEDACPIKKHFLNVVVDTYCSDAARIEDKVSAEIVDTVNQISDIIGTFDPSPLLHMACLNVTMNLTFSQRFDPQGRIAQEMYKTYESRSSMFRFHAEDFVRVLKAFTTSDQHDYTQELTARQIDCNRRLLNAHKDTYDPTSLRDVTDQLLLYVESGEDSGLLKQEDMDCLLLDTAGYGFQATAVTLTWLLGYMALNPDVQGQVHKEMDAVVGRDRLPCLDDQPYLPLTEAVMYEVQRLASVRPLLLPHRAKKDTVLQGFDIPQDTMVLFNVWGLHHDPRYWPNPTRFNPYRFLNEEMTLEIPDYFLPYGAGARQCPGESLADVQIFLFFTSMMHQLRVLPVPGQPNMTLEGEFDHLLRPKPFEIIVEERD